jgi:hypothetical protein
MADMSDAAVTSRLKLASELASLCVKLSNATPRPTPPTVGKPTQDPAVQRIARLERE